MDQGTVFYSWQSDRPPGVTRNLIETALTAAVRRTNADLHLAFEIDQDSRGEGGSPIISEAVKEKIENSVVFVADLTIVAKRERSGGLVNSNVAIEWGWAGAMLGNDSLIGVMNTFYGDLEDLPVDVRPHLVPGEFVLSDTADHEEVRSIGDALAGLLAKALARSVVRRFFRGLHTEAPRVVDYLVRSATNAIDHAEYSAEDLAQATGIGKEAALAVMEDLNRAGLVTSETARFLGSGFMVRPLLSLFVHFDPLYMGWNADRDARQLASELLRRGWFNVGPLSEELRWSARRMNPALFRIVQGKFALVSNAVSGASPFYREQLKLNENTRALAEGRASLPAVAPRAAIRID